MNNRIKIFAKNSFPMSAHECFNMSYLVFFISASVFSYPQVFSKGLIFFIQMLFWIVTSITCSDYCLPFSGLAIKLLERFC